MSEIRDADVRRLARVAAQLQAEYTVDHDPWEGSPFQWIKTLPSRRVGKIGEQLVSQWCAASGLDVRRSPDSEANRIIDGRRVEIKFSTLWKNGSYKFQQIRDQRYEYLVCLGIAPFDAHMWVVPKHVLHEHVIGHTPQHTGKTGTETFWLTVNPEAVPNWLVPYGGRLGNALDILLSDAR